MNLFFAFGALSEETERKIASLSSRPRDLSEKLLQLAQQRGATETDLSRLEVVLSAIFSISLEHIYPNYTTHPLRLAGAMLGYRGIFSLEEAIFCLAHNALEAGFFDEVKALVTEKTRGNIEAFTVDRARERDPGYIEEYYARLERQSLILPRAMDKLDNLLSFPKFGIENEELASIVTHVCPRLRKEDERVKTYLLAAVDYARSKEARP